MHDIDKYNKFVGALFARSRLNEPVNLRDKSEAVADQVVYMLDRTQSIFRYDGLPDSIPQRILELFLQVNGCVAFAEVEGKIYVFFGGLGGEPDEYYCPTVFTVANPTLDFSKNLKIGEDCVVMSNDSMYIGMVPLFRRRATMGAEAEISLYVALINSRIIDLISAEDDNTKASAEKFLKDIEDGKLGVIAGNAFLEGIKTLPYGSGANANHITQLIEAIQYNKAAWYNDIGLNANYNMKREALSSAESQLNDDALLPLIDDMLRCRRDALEKVNEMFGLNITVDLDSSWADNVLELTLEQEKLENEAEPEDPEEDPEEKEENNDDD